MADVSGVSSQVSSLMAQYRATINQPLTNLQNQQTSLNARLSVLADLRTRLTALNSAARNLKFTGVTSPFNVFSVDSSLASVVTGTATSSASSGVHTLLVTQLAKSDTVISSQLSAAATTISAAEGAGTKTIRIDVNGTPTEVSFDIADGDTNSTVLGNIAVAINAETDAGVSASVVADTTGTNRLVLTSKETGSAKAISLSDVTGTVLDSIGLGSDVISGRTASTGTTGGYLYSSVSSLDAKFKLDGIDITRGTNAVTDVLSGVTLNLKGTQAPADTPVTLNISSDTSTIESTLNSFISAYNDALNFLTAKTSTNPDQKTREIFASDQNFKQLRLNLRQLVGSAVSSVGTGNPSLLSDIGITAAADGTLSLDSAKLEAALSSGVTKVSDVFNSSGGIAVRLNALLDTYTTTNGQLDIAQNGAQDQLTYVKNNITRVGAQIDAKVQTYQTQYLAMLNLYSQITQQQQSIYSYYSLVYGVSTG